MKYSKDNPHPDLKFIETRLTSEGKPGITWYECLRCGTKMHGLHHSGWQCPFCEDEDLKKQVSE